MKIFADILKKSDEYSLIEESIRQNVSPITVSGLTDSSKAHLVFSLCANTDRNAVMVCESDYDAKRMYEDLAFFFGERAIYYPAKEMVYYEAYAKSHEYINERLGALRRLLESKEKTIFILGIEALLQFSVDYSEYLGSIMTMKTGDTIKIEDLCRRLDSLGYVREDMVEGTGQFSNRGGIVDVSVPDADNPYRIEFFGDEIDSIREFDPIEQTSISNVSEITISAAAETVSTEGAEPSVLSYFEKNTVIFYNEPIKIADRAEGFLWDINETVKSLIEKEVISEAKPRYIHDYDDTVRALLKYQFVALCSLHQTSKDFRPKQTAGMTVGAGSSYTGMNEFFFDELCERTRNGYSVLLPVNSESKISHVSEVLHENGINPVICDEKTDALIPGKVYICRGALKKGFYYPNLRFCVISDEELFGRRIKRKARTQKTDSASKIRSFSDIKPGDYVVHKIHGIGRYTGLNTLTVDGFNKDYLKIEYNGNDFLYVPCDSLEMIQKYIGKEGRIRLNKMGGSDFARQKAKVKESTKELAEELIKIYSQRQYEKGFAFSPDTAWQADFEAHFPYEETDDQLKSIEEVKADMEKERPMDRLLCGDVGYGKTEVALRAAFKACMDSKQVAYLAPTTVLCMQHFNTFKSRMKDYPVRVEMLSRLRSPSEQKEIIKKLASGEVDIVIGTHRLLGSDVKFRDLGLLVVDEEQRFGVMHKERIKEMKSNVDVLTLSATPIPRTLHMSMVSIKDMSTLFAPPEDRHPVSTVVTEYNEGIITDAIKRELSRGGQVYYLFNRVNGIVSKTRKIQEAIPSARVRYAHGQMEQGELEDIMMDMLGGEIDILVCTTIIETGLDIPNVNTIIIEDADRLGLSQLYQLRGRVGRSGRRAFAYLTYKRNKSLNEDAVKRLGAIKEFTEFGSGFKIAMRDLEIRGAGNILGAEQHGHMDSVGYDMYCKILAESVSELQGSTVLPDEEQITIDIPVSAHIPPEYIKNHTARLDIYKKIGAIENENDAICVCEEICDRFGDAPKSVYNLVDAALIKALCRETGINEIAYKNERLLFYFAKDVDFEKISMLIAVYSGRILLSAGARPYFSLNMTAEEKKNMTGSIKSLLQAFKDLHKQQN